MSGGRGAGDLPITYQGAYDATRTYLPRQMVTSVGSVYMAVAKTTGHTPSTTEVTPWLPLGGTPPAGVKSTSGFGLPSFAGRTVGDLHYDFNTGKEFVLTGIPGAGFVIEPFDGTGSLNGRATATGGLTWVADTTITLDGAGTAGAPGAWPGGGSTQQAYVNVGTSTQDATGYFIIDPAYSTFVVFISATAAGGGSLTNGFKLTLTPTGGPGVYTWSVTNLTTAAILASGGLTGLTGGQKLELARTAGGVVTASVNDIIVYTGTPAGATVGNLGGFGLLGSSSNPRIDAFEIGDRGTLAWTATDRNRENVNVVAASGAAVTLPDPEIASIDRVTLTANCTLTFPTAVAGASFTLTLVQDGTGSRTVTWPASVKWPGAAAPTLTPGAGKADVLSFMADDATNWRGSVVGLNY